MNEMIRMITNTLWTRHLLTLAAQRRSEWIVGAIYTLYPSNHREYSGRYIFAVSQHT
jgi:hypothetical protein